MRKKTFYQTNIFWQLFCFMFLVAFVTCFIIGVQLIIGFFSNGLGENIADKFVSIILLVLYFTATFLILKMFIRFEHNNIHLTDEKMYMNDDWNNKNNKIQYYSEVKFIDIVSIDIIWTKKNSKGKLIKSRFVSALVEKPYLSIKTKNADIINFFVMYVSKKDVIKLINEIRVRMTNVGNEIDIIKENEALLKINKKKHIKF